VSSPEAITAITTGIAALITAIGAIIVKYRKSKKVDFEGCADIYRKSYTLIKYIKNNFKPPSKDKKIGK
jgi:hypothetical protein